MAKKARTLYVCSECGYSSGKWLGRCPECGSWGTLAAQASAPAGAGGGGGRGAHRSTAGVAPASPAKPISSLRAADAAAVTTGIGELDRVLGRGIVPGSVVLLAGEPGVGKSTLLLEVAARWARQRGSGDGNRVALYVTAEESAGQVRLRAERTGAVLDTLYLAAESDLDTLIGHVEAVSPSLLIVDSVQTVQAAGVEGVAGGVAQSRAVTAALTSLAKSRGLPVLLVGHVTKDGNVAGPRTLEHLVDVVLNFEGDRHSSLRMLRGLKNRFGATDEVGCFEQTADGIAEVPDPSGLFLSHRDDTPDGAAVTVAMDGVRPLLAEVQSLAVQTSAKTPRRVVTGLDPQRVPMVLAVLAARAGLSTADREVYVATVGGMRIREPATDLAVAMATVSTLKNKPLPPRTVYVGEVGLAGELRRVSSLKRRLQEAARLGYRRAVVPAGDAPKVEGIGVIPAETLKDAIAA